MQNVTKGGVGGQRAALLFFLSIFFQFIFFYLLNFVVICIMFVISTYVFGYQLPLSNVYLFMYHL